MIYLAILFVVAVLLLLWKPNGSARDPEKSSIDTRDTRTAVHEAGHAVVALHCTQVVEVMKITIDSTAPDALGHFTWRTVVSDLSGWCDAVVALSGMAAESLMFQKYRSSSFSVDLDKAITAVREVIHHGSVATPWEGNESVDPGFRRMFERGVTDEELRILTLCYAKAKTLLRKHHVEHMRLSGALLGVREMDAAALKRWFGSRGFIRLVGQFSKKMFV